MEVNRCQGSCDNALILETCTPTKIRNITVRVYTESGDSYEVAVADHEECKCTCRIQCDPQIHVLDEKLCKCDCSKKCPDGKIQDPSTCVCVYVMGKQEKNYLG